MGEKDETAPAFSFVHSQSHKRPNLRAKIVIELKQSSTTLLNLLSFFLFLSFFSQQVGGYTPCLLFHNETQKNDVPSSTPCFQLHRFFFLSFPFYSPLLSFSSTHGGLPPVSLKFDGNHVQGPSLWLLKRRKNAFCFFFFGGYEITLLKRRRKESKGGKKEEGFGTNQPR